MNQNRKLVNRSISVYGKYDSIDPENLIKLREEKKQSLPEELHHLIHFELDTRYEKYDPEEYVDLFMKWQDYETDEEYNNRIALEKQREEAKLEKDRAEFERLRKQFGA